MMKSTWFCIKCKGKTWFKYWTKRILYLKKPHVKQSSMASSWLQRIRIDTRMICRYIQIIIIESDIEIITYYISISFIFILTPITCTYNLNQLRGIYIFNQLTYSTKTKSYFARFFSPMPFLLELTCMPTYHKNIVPKDHVSTTCLIT